MFPRGLRYTIQRNGTTPIEDAPHRITSTSLVCHTRHDHMNNYIVADPGRINLLKIASCSEPPFSQSIQADTHLVGPNRFFDYNDMGVSKSSTGDIFATVFGSSCGYSSTPTKTNSDRDPLTAPPLSRCQDCSVGSTGNLPRISNCMESCTSACYYLFAVFPCGRHFHGGNSSPSARPRYGHINYASSCFVLCCFFVSYFVRPVSTISTPGFAHAPIDPILVVRGKFSLQRVHGG